MHNAQTAVAYIRCSTDEQHLSPAAQRREIEAWAARCGVKIAAWHADEGVSGAAPIQQRKALLDAIASLRGHGAGLLVAKDRTRLARDVAAAKTIEALVRKEGAAVRTADGASDATGSSRVIQTGVHDLFAEYEREVIRERTTAALAVKKAKGERVGTLPYGYQLADDGKTLEPNEDEQTVIALVHGLRDAGMSMRQIVVALADKGVRGRTGKPLALTSIANMLRALRALSTAA